MAVESVDAVPRPTGSASGTLPPGTVQRHAAIDRAFHWATAATMLALIVTGLAPVLGLRIEWFDVHWIGGVLLTLVILLHIVRAVTVQRLRSMVPRPSDLRELSGVRPGKYSLAQKLMHLAWTVAVLVAIVTGGLLMIKAGTPLFERNPYVLTLETWGVLTLLHDLAALLSVFLVLVHVYFGLLPEKRAYLRSMVRGWMTRGELAENHDPERVARGD
jgi:formate dehydrogenase subunit gamma